MQRARKILEQKADCNQVKKDAKRPRDAVVRGPAFSIDVLDGNLADGSAVPRSQCGNETMQFSIQRYPRDDLAPIGLEGGAEIVNVNAAQLGHQPVGAARGDTAEPEV